MCQYANVPMREEFERSQVGYKWQSININFKQIKQHCLLLQPDLEC